MGNAFIDSAKKSKLEQASVEGGSAAAKPEKTERQAVNVDIPKELHRKAMLHRIETGESVTQLIIRLLSQELD